MERSWKSIFVWASILLSLRITHQADNKANVALGGEAAQSTVLNPLLLPNVAIDGRPDSNSHLWSCTVSLLEINPWWRLDLQDEYVISSIEVIRRSDCCSFDLEGAEIRIGNSLENNGNDNPRCAVITIISDVTMTFSCSQMRGRYVNIVVPGILRVLALCEVRVYTTIPIKGVNVALGGEAAQTSVWDQFNPPSFVIDGKPYANYLHKSCTSTKQQANPWWRLDMRGPYDVTVIEVIQRSDCCISELEGTEIRLGNSLENNGNNNPRCAVITITNDVTMIFDCTGMSGRYVNLFLPGERKIIQICEVKVYGTPRITGVNVAQRGKATLSATTLLGALGTCASTPVQDNPWWQLDLMSIYRITAVAVITTKDCCPEKLDGAEIRIGLKSDTSNPRCAVISIAEGQHKYIYQCGIMDGRFVHVVLPGLQKSLTICDVWVYGTVLENVALRGLAFQSSSRHQTAGRASSVIDSSMFNTCSMTEIKPGQWVTVDLLAPYNVTVIQLAYRMDCCYSDEVQVDYTSCGVISASSQSVVTLNCGGIVGRYVTVFRPDVPMPLCELEVYSTLVDPRNKVPPLPPRHDYCLHTSCSYDYILIHDQPKTWFEAQAYCRENYVDLATIINVQDMNWVIDKTKNDLYDFWIGLYEDVLTWRWSLPDEGYYGDGEAEFRNWGDGEPSNNGGIQHCTGIQHTGEWKDLDCDLLHYFLCFDGRASATETKILVETPMKWADAQRYCRDTHTDLLSVRSQAENQEIRGIVPWGKLAWIGLLGDAWMWSDGNYSSFRYEWQGPRKSPEEGPNCAHISERKWSARSCNTKSVFLCYDRHKKRSVVRISTDSDMSDAIVQQQISSQLVAELNNKGISDIKVHWKTSTTQTKNSTTDTQPSVSPQTTAVGGET